MKTKRSVESKENAPSNRKVIKKLTLDRETVRSMGVKTNIQAGLTGVPCHGSTIEWFH